MAGSTPFEAYGYSVNRLTSSAEGLACGVEVQSGAPLLAIPLSSCWTAQSVSKESPALAKHLNAAIARNPHSKVLQSDATWIAMHLLEQKCLGAQALPHRTAYLNSLPEKLETLLAWEEDEFLALKGSSWQQEASHRLETLEQGYEALLTELGPEVVEELRLELQPFIWAHQVIQQFAVYIQGPDGFTRTILVPALEFLEPPVNVDAEVAAARVEWLDPEPVFIVYSKGHCQQGDRITFSRCGLATGTGFQLLSRGWATPDNASEQVDVILTLPVQEEVLEHNEKFWEVVTGLAGALLPPLELRPGDCLQMDTVQRSCPVKLTKKTSGPELHVVLRLSRTGLLPNRNALAYLGLVVLFHPDRMEAIVKDETEKRLVNVLGQEQCERRALRYLQLEMQTVLEKYPARSADSLQPLSEGSLPTRTQRSWHLISSERKLLADALSEVDRLLSLDLADFIAYRSSADASQDIGYEDEIRKASVHLAGCTQALEQLDQWFSNDLQREPSSDSTAGERRKAELSLLVQLVAGSQLGNPMAASMPPLRRSSNARVQADGRANLAVQKATLASLKWDVARLQQSPDGSSPDGSTDLHTSLVAEALVHMRLGSFDQALDAIQRSLLQRAPSKALPLQLAQECAAMVAAQGSVLGSPGEPHDAIGWMAASTRTIQNLKIRLAAVGYIGAGLSWPLPLRVPAASSLATAFQTRWSPTTESCMQSAARGVGMKPGEYGPVPEPSKIGSLKELQDAICLFVLHNALPLRRVVRLLGLDVCKLLLQHGALSGYMIDEGRLLEPAESIRCLDIQNTLQTHVFANIALWPVEGNMLVATDFDQNCLCEGNVEPVMYLTEDAGALFNAAPKKSRVERVLDVHCGGGAQGLLALKQFASQAVFLDANPRALRFARFNAHMNCLHERCMFVQGDISDSTLPGELTGQFDAILACLPFLPNPEDVLTNSGPMYAHGGRDGQRVLSALVAQATRHLLAPLGWLVTSAVVPNSEELSSRVMSWADESLGRTAGVRAAVLRGESMSIQEVLPAVAVGCSEVQKTSWLQNLRDANISTMSPTILLMWACPAGMEPNPPGHKRSETLLEHRQLWADSEYLLSEVQGTLDRWGSAVDVHRTLARGSTGDLVFPLEWTDGQELETQLSRTDNSQALALQLVPRNNQATTVEILRSRLKTKKRKKVPAEDKGLEAAGWSEILAVPARGFAPPALCNVVWREAHTLRAKDTKPLPQLYRRSPPPTKFRTALVEMWGCYCPVEVKLALRDALNCSDRLAFEGEPRMLRLMSGDGNSLDVLREYDVLLVPLLNWESSASGTFLTELPNEVLDMLNAIYDEVLDTKHPIRVVFVTSCSIGPNYTEGVTSLVPSASPLLGLLRVARMEVPQVALLCVDSDTYDATELASQVVNELEKATPVTGMKKASPIEKAMAFYSTNREVAYRGGRRYLQKLDLSARMPIYIGRACPVLTQTLAAGPILITGGTGGLGLIAAQALAESGAKLLILASRSGAESLPNNKKLQDLRDQGVGIVVEKCDLSDEEQVFDLLGNIRSTYGSIRAIIHASGVQDNKPILYQDDDSMDCVFGPKAFGAWLLHVHTLEDHLEAFVLFSSVASLFGFPGQANYAAASSYLDELALWRAAQGLAAVSVQWPAIAFKGEPPKNKDGMQTSLSVDAAKQVMKQLMCGTEAITPVQAVLPEASLTPTSPTVASLLQPLTALGKKTQSQ